jgi:hypothetical protein
MSSILDSVFDNIHGFCTLLPGLSVMADLAELWSENPIMSINVG